MHKCALTAAAITQNATLAFTYCTKTLPVFTDEYSVISTMLDKRGRVILVRAYLNPVI